MRKAFLLLLLAPSALVYACGGDSSTGDAGGNDATTNDVATKDSSTTDTSTNDTGTQDTGVTDAGIDVQLALDCFKPADCVDGGSADAAYPPNDAGVVCCGNIEGNGNTQACQITGASTTCKAPGQCNTSFTGLATCSSATVRFCSTAAECTEQGNNLCCTANAGDAGSFKVCANQGIAAISQGKITCN